MGAAKTVVARPEHGRGIHLATCILHLASYTRMTPQAAYDELVRRSRERSLLVSCIELVGWDELTYMPRGGVENRSRQMAYLAGLYHDAVADPPQGELL